jgi:hypothetical protein
VGESGGGPVEALERWIEAYLHPVFRNGRITTHLCLLVCSANFMKVEVSRLAQENK